MEPTLPMPLPFPARLNYHLRQKDLRLPRCRIVVVLQHLLYPMAVAVVVVVAVTLGPY
jgi:hypothetical protein